MQKKIGIVKEVKPWENRTALTPENLAYLKAGTNCSFAVEDFADRCFSIGEYEKAAASAAMGTSDLSDCDILLGIKEIEPQRLLPGKIYLFFSHTIKGQAANMPMLKKIIKQGSTLLDYECIVDQQGKRLVYFGNWAGYAGMGETLAGFGKRLEKEGFANPFDSIKQPWQYGELAALQKAVQAAPKKLSPDFGPCVIGLAGYGNVAKGAQKVLDLLEPEPLPPERLITEKLEPGKIYKVVFREEHTVRHKQGKSFDLDHYYEHPEEYDGCFSEYVPYLTVLVNTIYWTDRQPRLITRKGLKNIAKTQNIALRFIGDISCDIEGAIECTHDVTTPEAPVYTYNWETESHTPGIKAGGIQIMAVDNLPCELPRQASTTFSNSLMPFLPPLIRADFKINSFEDLDLPRELKKATIVYRGKLTPDYDYLKKNL